MVHAKAKPEGEGGPWALEDARAHPPLPANSWPGQLMEASPRPQPRLPAHPPRSHCNVTRRRSDDPRSLAWGPLPPCHFGWRPVAASSRWGSRLVGRASLMRFAAVAVLARRVRGRIGSPPLPGMALPLLFYAGWRAPATQPLLDLSRSPCPRESRLQSVKTDSPLAKQAPFSGGG